MSGINIVYFLFLRKSAFIMLLGNAFLILGVENTYYKANKAKKMEIAFLQAQIAHTFSLM